MSKSFPAVGDGPAPAILAALDRAGMTLDGPQSALLVQGDDRMGALAEIHAKLMRARVNVYASTAGDLSASSYISTNAFAYGVSSSRSGSIQAGGTVCATKDPETDLRLDCASGFGTVSYVTGAFGFALAGGGKDGCGAVGVVQVQERDTGDLR